MYEPIVSVDAIPSASNDTPAVPTDAPSSISLHTEEKQEEEKEEPFPRESPYDRCRTWGILALQCVTMVILWLSGFASITSDVKEDNDELARTQMNFVTAYVFFALAMQMTCVVLMSIRRLRGATHNPVHVYVFYLMCVMSCALQLILQTIIAYAGSSGKDAWYPVKMLALLCWIVVGRGTAN